MGSAATVSVALIGANALGYGFTVLAARVLVPGAYSELAALFGVLLIGVVPAAGLQTAIALRSAGWGPRDAARAHAAAMVTAVAVGVAALAAVRPLTALLHLSGPAAAVWLALALVPHTLLAGYDGILQGGRRFGRLAAVTVGFHASKVGGGVAGLLAGGDVGGAVAGTAVGTAAGAVLAWWGAGRPGLAGDCGDLVRLGARTAGALLGIVVLVNLDLLLARHHLAATEAGAYAVGSVVAKIAFWLPQGLGVVVLPRLADARSRLRSLTHAVSLVLAAGGMLTAAAALMGPLVLPLVGGDAYAGVPVVPGWPFAALGTLVAVVQLVVWSGVAAADPTAVAIVWAAVAGEAIVVTVLGAVGSATASTIVLVAVSAATVTVVAGLWRAAGGDRPPRPALPPIPRPCDDVSPAGSFEVRSTVEQSTDRRSS